MSNIKKYAGKRVAILAVTSASGVEGGAERFYRGLLDAVNQQVEHVDLINYPADESTFEHIIQNYEFWQQLGLSSYDLVISTKAPTYAVKHPNHILYLVHTIRVFYDMFDDVFPNANEELHAQRSLVHKFDNEAFSGIRHHFSIGHEVSKRLRKWNGIDAQVLHPPLVMDRFRQSEQQDYFFLPGRLHQWKRVDLAIQSFKASSNMQMKLKIAGTGEAESSLRLLADGDPRIEFLGHVSDDELIEYYSNALAVVFVPIREDYGYITLEAFKSGKPVIICTDSGEPLQFVQQDITGMVCQPVPAEIARAMEYLWMNKQRAREMGLKGMQSIKHITWESTADKLLSAGFDSSEKRKDEKIKVVIIDMQPIDPPVGGGRLRLLGLYHNLGCGIEAKYIGTYDWPGEKHRRHMLSPGLEEVNVPLSQEHHNAAKELANRAGGKVIIDIAFPRLGHLSHEFLSQVKSEMAEADIVIFSHPWVFPLVKDSLQRSQLVVYDSQNVEGYLRAQLLDQNNPVEQELLREVVKAEYAVGHRADLIIACSQDDVELFSRIYDWSYAKLCVVPNGVMAKYIKPATNEAKSLARGRLGLGTDNVIAIFIGSSYKPNVDAAEFIISELAPYLEGVDFVIAGGVGGAIKTNNLPVNVKVTGSIEESDKIHWLHASDFAINPMFSGSGTNIKMFDFMAAGLPIVTTRIGARGIAEHSAPGLWLATRGEFRTSIANLLGSSGEYIAQGKLNRGVVESKFAWEKISCELGNMLRQMKARAIRSLRIAHLTTMGIKCGIGEYTSRIIEHLPSEDHFVVTCETSQVYLPRSIAEPQTTIGWFFDNQMYAHSKIYPNTIDKIVQWGADVVLIQFHPGFYSDSTLLEFVLTAINRKLKVVIINHNIFKSDTNILQQLVSLNIIVISHSKREVDYAKSFGIKINHLPLGIVSYCDKSEIKNIDGRNWITIPPVIVSTGFLRHHKGIPELIRAIDILQSSFPGAKLLLQCALYPSEDSKQIHQECLNLIAELKLDHLVDLNTDFIPIHELHHNLSRADLAILPYHESDEGGSGSATTCLAAGVPLIVSNAEIFNEISGAVYPLAETTPQAIAECIHKILSNVELYKDIALSGRSYLEDNSFQKTTFKLVEMINRKE